MDTKKNVDSNLPIHITGPLKQFYPSDREFYFCKMEKYLICLTRNEGKISRIEKGHIVTFCGAYMSKTLHGAFKLIYKFYNVSTNQYVESVMSEHFLSGGELNIEKLTHISKVSFENFNMFFKLVD